jgi:hypothetical protein
MPTPKDKVLYEKVKKMADEKYKKPKEFKRWFEAEWMNIDPNKTKTSYPVYRPTIRINKQTPLLVSEIDPKQLEQQIKLKQKIKGNKNLPPFKKK